MTQAVDITLLGKSYRVACPEGEEQNLRRAADEMSNRMQELKVASKVGNAEHLAIMVGLKLSYDLQQVQMQNKQHQEDMNHRIKELQLTIERALLDQSGVSE